MCDKIYKFNELIEKLRREHNHKYVYRGQTKDYGNLFSSGYRWLVKYKQTYARDSKHSLYQRGSAFYPLSQPYEISLELAKVLDFVSHIRPIFGYPLSQIFAQHCLLPTEGVDVTSDIEIVALFSVYKYGEGNSCSDSDGNGVIYRINKDSKPVCNIAELAMIDYYNCPFYLSSYKILELFENCESIDQAFESLAHFKQLRATGDYYSFRKKRPLELLKFPKRELEKGRIIIQNAGLISPDVIIPNLWNLYPVPPPAGKTHGNEQCVEDLNKNNNIEKFTFFHENDNRNLINADPATIFPIDDPIKNILLNIMTVNIHGKQQITHQDLSIFVSGDEDKIVQ